MTTKQRFPHCTRLQVLRTISGRTVISTSALYEALGWKKYRQFLPYMKHEGGNCGTGYVTPSSCEEWLQTARISEGS
jgi:hypothetical protein